MRGGLLGILLIIGIFYFTDAGGWVWNKLKGLNDNCYSALASAGPQVANPVCGAVARGFGALEHVGEAVAASLDGIKQRVFGANSGGSLDGFMQDMRGEMASLTSSKEKLVQMIQNGPRAGNSGSVAQQFQQAIDSFSIGQHYLGDSSQAANAVPWLQQGAAQPQGFGVMSQLALGNLYLHGGQGVPANLGAAQAYLQQAQASLGILSSSDSPQAKQLMGALPASPQVLQQQITRILAGIPK